MLNVYVIVSCVGVVVAGLFNLHNQ